MDDDEWLKIIRDFNGLLTVIALATCATAILVAVGLLKLWG
jgi:hypothetical protein